MLRSLLPTTPRGLALALATLALVGAAFAGPANQRAEATAPDPDATVISLTCELADDLIGCQLISAREFDRDEGVRFVVSVGGETQTVSATREVDRDGGVRFVVSVGGETQDGSETGPPSGAGSACGEDDGVCYAFSFTAFGAGDDVQVSEVEAISEDDAAPAQQAAQAAPQRQADAPPRSDQAAESRTPPVTDSSPASDPPAVTETAGDAGSEPAAVVAKEDWPETKEVLENGIEIVDRPEGDSVVTITPNGEQISISRTDADGDGGDVTSTDSQPPEWHEYEQPGEIDEGEAHIDETTDDASLVVLNYPDSQKGDDDHADNWESVERTYFELRQRGEPFIVCDPARDVHTVWTNPETGEVVEKVIHVTELCWTEYP
ncbi:MAG: hypothetical protein F4Z77_07220 [Dehalococcoidia bacterium]|nr:hypothetical protein [Dehalococcoidia bacterium]MYA54452.1 hypothetical protein [Dehalococcoidia bacterium]